MSDRLIFSEYSRRDKNKRTKVSKGIVLDVIVNEDSDAIYDTGVGENESRNVNEIGYAKIRPLHDATSNVNDLKYYPPYDYSNLDLPIVGEVVDIISTESDSKSYRRITSSNLNTGNAVENPQAAFFSRKEKRSSGKSKDYKSTSQTGTTNNSSTTDDELKNEYFEAEQVNHLTLYEGDKLIQSRFGQSIRFSGYNNENNVFAPTIIIRNRQGDKITEDTNPGSPIEEDVVDDGSTIAMTSGEYLLEFVPGTVDTPLETEPINFEEPELKGTDQVLINSGRLILSSKDSEMIFYSKGDYAFISDGTLHVENGEGGGLLDFGDDVLITTDRNGANFRVFTGNGNIGLNTDDGFSSEGTGRQEPLVRGETLKELLEELIKLIGEQVFQTPAGPTTPGPVNKPQFEQLKSKFVDFLSTLNYTE